MAKIDTLVSDIFAFLENPGNVSDEECEAFGHKIAQLMKRRLQERQANNTLRMSNIGTPCERKLWYRVNSPDKGEPLRGSERLKFLYGDFIEALVLFLARLTGHSVAEAQTEVEVNGVKGHPDGIIDGRLVDVKSASHFGFKKFATHGLMGDDPFGYIDQIGSYHYALKDHPALEDKENVSFLAIDKQSGAMCLDTYPVQTKDYGARVDELRSVLVQPSPPPRAFGPVEDYRGTKKLGINCSYCEFKETCWPNLQTKMVSGRPIFLPVLEENMGEF
jgi:hypothetical protein